MLASVHDQVTEVPVREVEEPLPGITPLPCPRDVGHGTDNRYERRSLFHRYRVDRDDLQGNLLQPYGNAFDHARYLFVEIGSEDVAGRRLVRELADQVTTAAEWPGGHKPLQTLNVGISWRGLQALGVPEPLLCCFPREFRAGMNTRSEVLGDTHGNHPDHWEDGLKQPELIVTIMAQDEQVLRFADDALRTRIDRLGLGAPHAVEAQLLVEPGLEELPSSRPGRQHFGFADGFSQPAVRGFAKRSEKLGMGTPSWLGLWRMVAPGEFVLGYPGEGGLLPPAPPDPLGRNGSYMVVRKLEQDVAGFAAYLKRAARSLPGLPDETDPGYANAVKDRALQIAGKVVGRWPNGRSLVLWDDPAGSPGEDEPINDFRYRGNNPDPDGFGCPLGAHVRRANPRDGFGWRGQLTRRHRIIRRSMPYGRPPYDPAVPPDAEHGLLNCARPDGERYRTPEDPVGLMFVCFQASIARQFEVIQGQWLNGGNAFWLGEDKDLLTAAVPGSNGKMTIQGRPPSYIRAPAEQSVAPGGFVTTRGGGYFFAPGLTALRALGAGSWR
jgi:Dyp-type peroxidase family